MLVIGGISVAAIVAAVFVYLQVSSPEKSKAAAHPVVLDQAALPTDLKVDAMVIATPDTNQRQVKYKVAKPLSQTPHLEE